MQLVHDYSSAEFGDAMLGLGKIGKVYKLPRVCGGFISQARPMPPILAKRARNFEFADCTGKSI